MAEFMGNKKRLTINLSLFAANDNNASAKSATKSPKSFEPDGVVGLGIVAAMNELDQNHGRASILAASPRSTPIPIGSGSAKFGGGNSSPEEEPRELSEEYTCVISHVGNNVIKKREYFDDNLASESERRTARYCLDSKFSSASPPPPPPPPVVAMAAGAFQTEGFLNSCYLCKKKLQGLDIFMYRGEKAFCSAECRCQQISTDERKEKRGSGMKKPLAYSVSPCSSPMQFFVGVAAA